MTQRRINPKLKLLPYQARWIEDRSRIKVCEKSRRVGITWATAFDAVLDAACGECDCWYLAYAEDAAQEFILDALKWAENLGLVNGFETDSVMVDEDGNPLDPALDREGIRAFRLTFRSGKRITALSSSPRSLRGKSGRVIVDEAAFHPDVAAVKKAATALLMWGGSSRVEFISTHNGVDNPFNQMVLDGRSGKEPYSVHRIDLDDALRDGLYKRICLVNDQPWSEEGELEWRAQVIRDHGIDADEELFCVPVENKGAGWFKRANFRVIKSIREISVRPPTVERAIRFWDFAATRPSAKNPDPDYTVGARVLKLSDGSFLIDNIDRLRDDPGAVHRHMLEVAQEDGREVEVGTWQDPGAGGKADAAAKGRDLTGFTYHSPKAAKNKVDFAKPWASLAEQGRVYVLDRDWTEEFLQELERFPNGRHDDQVDAVSGAFEVMLTHGAYNTDWAKAWSGTW